MDLLRTTILSPKTTSCVGFIGGAVPEMQKKSRKSSSYKTMRDKNSVCKTVQGEKAKCLVDSLVLRKSLLHKAAKRWVSF